MTDEANDLLLLELDTFSNMVGWSMMNILIDEIPVSDWLLITAAADIGDAVTTPWLLESTIAPPRFLWNDAPKTMTLALGSTGCAITNEVVVDLEILAPTKSSTTLSSVARDTLLFVDDELSELAAISANNERASALCVLFVVLLFKTSLTIS